MLIWEQQTSVVYKSVCKMDNEENMKDIQVKDIFLIGNR